MVYFLNRVAVNKVMRIEPHINSKAMAIWLAAEAGVALPWPTVIRVKKLKNKLWNQSLKVRLEL